MLNLCCYKPPNLPRPVRTMIEILITELTKGVFESVYLFTVFSFHSEWQSPTEPLQCNITVAFALLLGRVPNAFKKM